MTPAEREELHDLTVRLFGAEGSTGAIGAIHASLESLLNDKLVRDTLAAQQRDQQVDRRRRDDRREAARLVIASVIGGGVMAIVSQVVLAMLRVPR